jgi:peptidoglycan-associated lipoprotein
MNFKEVIRFSFIVILVLAGCNSLFAQSKLHEKGDKAFETGEFYKAVEIYLEAYKKTDNKVEKAEIQFKTAECYRILNNSQKAESFYRKAITKGYQNPLAILYFADALKNNEKYEEAEQEFKKYRELVPDDARGEVGERSCKLSAEWIEKPTRYVIEAMPIINSKLYDFSPAFASEDYKTLYFTSTRQAGANSKINPVSGEFYSNIFSTTFTKKLEWSEPEPLNDTINSMFDDASPSLSPDGTELFFNRCRQEKNKVSGCQIYYSVRSPGGDWESTTIIDIFGDSIDVVHPSISHDGKKLYFSSNKLIGQGNYDIWVVEREGKGSPWGKPKNLGKDINTIGNEINPYIRKDGTLYFSSNQHLGMGGLDIFKAVPQPNGSWKIENMKHPINSAADDFGIIFMGDEEKGFFTTRRRAYGAKGSDDIFYFELPPLEFSLQGKVRDANTDKPLAGAKIKIICSDGSPDIDLVSLEDGSFKNTLKKNTDYLFVVSLEGYLKGKGKVSTHTLDDSYTFMNDVKLAPLNTSIDLPNIFYDFGDWNLREESKIELESLVKTLNNNPNITIEIGSHTDMVGNDADNLTLSQKRAQSVVDFLVSKGIPNERLTAKGFGETTPKTITEKIAQNSIFDIGTVLTPDFINGLDTDEEKAAANQINRRTDFKVLRTNYIPKIN